MVDICGVTVNCLVDSGATLSVLHPDKYHAIPEARRPPMESNCGSIKMADGNLVVPLGHDPTCRTEHGYSSLSADGSG